jgi:hypothetical protein
MHIAARELSCYETATNRRARKHQRLHRSPRVQNPDLLHPEGRISPTGLIAFIASIFRVDFFFAQS